MQIARHIPQQRLIGRDTLLGELVKLDIDVVRQHGATQFVGRSAPRGQLFIELIEMSGKDRALQRATL